MIHDYDLIMAYNTVQECEEGVLPKGIPGLSGIGIS